MFAPRNEDGIWFLAIRRGRIIRVATTWTRTEKCAFTSHAKAGQCADELNEKYLKEYEKYFTREGKLLKPVDGNLVTLMNDMCEVISKYNGKRTRVSGRTSNQANTE